MIPVLAAGAGDPGLADRGVVGRALDRGELVSVRHRDLLVAWSPRCPWIDHYDDGDVVVVVDGRLHRPLCSADEAARTLARRYRDRGGALARGVLGDFVAVVLDRRRGTLLVARDPLGVRPWYQATAAGRYAGASTERSVASLPWVDDRVDERTAIEHLAALWARTGATFHRGVTTLAPGHTATVAGGRIRTHRHHEWHLRADLTTSWDEAIERCREVLDVAVAARLHAGGPATSELSGGLDSSAVVGTACRLGADDLLVARLGFHGPAADERAWSDVVAGHWGLPVVTAEPAVPDAAAAAALSETLGRPVPDPHFTMFAGLHRALLARGRPDGLTGLGGDDAFVSSSTGTLLVSALRRGRAAEVADLVRAAGPSPRDLWTGLVRPAMHHAARWRGRRIPGWVRADAARRADLERTLRRRPEPVTGVAAIDERIDNLTSGHDALVLETRAVVADLEGRRDSHPYLDPRFIEATYGLDPWWPRREGHTRALQVAAFADRLPPAVAARRTKAEFSEVFWDPLLDTEVLDRLRTGPIAALGWLDPAGLDALVHDAARGAAQAAIPLARCVSLDRWLRTR